MVANEQLMVKGYIRGWKEREDAPPQPRTVIDVWFNSTPDKAAVWKTEEEAQTDCLVFNSWRIEIPSSEGGIYVCGDFRVEERAVGEFVVFCEGPFTMVGEPAGRTEQACER